MSCLCSRGPPSQGITLIEHGRGWKWGKAEHNQLFARTTWFGVGNAEDSPSQITQATSRVCIGSPLLMSLDCSQLVLPTEDTPKTCIKSLHPERAPLPDRSATRIISPSHQRRVHTRLPCGYRSSGAVGPHCETGEPRLQYRWVRWLTLDRLSLGSRACEAFPRERKHGATTESGGKA